MHFLINLKDQCTPHKSSRHLPVGKFPQNSLLRRNLYWLTRNIHAAVTIWPWEIMSDVCDLSGSQCPVFSIRTHIWPCLFSRLHSLNNSLISLDLQWHDHCESLMDSPCADGLWLHGKIFSSFSDLGWNAAPYAVLWPSCMPDNGSVSCPL